ncbi:hypothetical protein BGX29_010567 [Mortierella sp. GBA35]|nr:hypothetical protein BGX29_010567 [Mortierella sp. GBA35]
MELPVELEYIPYDEFEERFSKLNEIATPIYPTIWPNVLMIFVFASLICTAAVGMARNSSGLAVMGQVACFVIPILAILWIRIRKESKARARKQFKRRSIKLLREWAEQDTTAFAIQWKLRLRVWSDVRRRREAAAELEQVRAYEQEQEQEQDQEQEQQVPQSVAIQVSSRMLFTETRVWMIEISRRDGVMDEYALTVPSPVYCGYRLPGYDDVLSQSGSGGDQVAVAIGGEGASPNATMNSSAQQQPRYAGPPPSYFSDSEDDENSDDEDDDQQQRATNGGGGGQSSRSDGGGPTEQPGGAGGERVTLSGAYQHQRPIEMTTVTLSSGPTAAGGVRIGGQQLGRLGNHAAGQGSTMSTMSITTSAMTSQTTLALTLADKDEELATATAASTTMADSSGKEGVLKTGSSE